MAKADLQPLGFDPSLFAVRCVPLTSFISVNCTTTGITERRIYIAGSAIRISVPCSNRMTILQTQSSTTFAVYALNSMTSTLWEASASTAWTSIEMFIVVSAIPFSKTTGSHCKCMRSSCTSLARFAVYSLRRRKSCGSTSRRLIGMCLASASSVSTTVKTRRVSIRYAYSPVL